VTYEIQNTKAKTKPMSIVSYWVTRRILLFLPVLPRARHKP
jgi:hypothetical protein